MKQIIGILSVLCHASCYLNWISKSGLILMAHLIKQHSLYLGMPIRSVDAYWHIFISNESRFSSALIAFWGNPYQIIGNRIYYLYVLSQTLYREFVCLFSLMKTLRSNLFCSSFMKVLHFLPISLISG